METRPFKLVLLGLLAVHAILTGIAFIDHGYLGFFPPFKDSNTTQIFSDLTLALSLVTLWIYVDLQHLGKSRVWFLSVLVGTVLLGSIAPLVYLLLRKPLTAEHGQRPPERA